MRRVKRIIDDMRRRCGYKRMLSQHPHEVDILFDVISKRLGREALIRQVKNKKDYYLIDIAFSYFQKADRNRQVGYRSGFCFRKPSFIYKELMFIIVHSPIMFSFFQQNFDYDVFRSILEKTGKYRDCNYMYYTIFNKNRDTKETFEISTESMDAFLKEIDLVESQYGFAKTVFSAKNSSKANLGNTYYLLIANKFTTENISEIIDISWDLFMWLYPSKPLFSRDATLNRSMRNIERKCEFHHIKNLPNFMTDIECEGVIQAAHIKPHHKGGSDKMENGLWLCEKHHRLTEGKISGRRNKTAIDVRYIS